MTGLTNEVVKNLVLAGLGGVCLMDAQTTSEKHVREQFFLRASDTGKPVVEAMLPRVKDMNPRVDVTTEMSEVSDKDVAFFGQFNIVCLVGADLPTMIKVNEKCREAGVKFYAADQWGGLGWVFCDALKHEFVVEIIKSKDAEPVHETKVIDYPSLNDAFADTELWQGLSARRLKREVSPVYFAIRLFLQYQKRNSSLPALADYDKVLVMRDELLQTLSIDTNFLADDFIKSTLDHLNQFESPVCAIVGGVLAQDIIRIISRKDQPISNMFLFNADDFSGLVHPLGLSKNLTGT